MWVNGTALSAQARRALENERVTMIAHETGIIHTIYPEATIQPEAYERFASQMRVFLSTALDAEVLGNFLRHNSDIQECFQLRWPRHGVDHYISVDRVLAYESNSSYRMTDNTRAKLMDEIDAEELHCQPLPSRVILNDLEQFIKDQPIDIHSRDDVQRLKGRFASDCMNAEKALETLVQFCHIEPQLPDQDAKQFQNGAAPLNLDIDMTREDVIERLQSIRESNTMAGLAFYAYRDLNQIEPEAFLQACLTRNPVSITALSTQDDDSVVATLNELPSESIYDEDGRLAQPDEVWNFARGDGAEKALLLANVLRDRHPEATLRFEVSPTSVTLNLGDKAYSFSSTKQLNATEWHYGA
jgi:hypothetical protein